MGVDTMYQYCKDSAGTDTAKATALRITSVIKFQEKEDLAQEVSVDLEDEQTSGETQ